MVDEILCSPNKDKYLDSLVSLSVVGVRFRCPHCDYVDVNLKFVRDHMAEHHRGKKNKELQPRRQEMKVKIKPPRIYKETILKSVAYYKSFGGQFFSTGVQATVEFVQDPVHYIRNIRYAGKPQDKPCPKRFKKFFREQKEASVPSMLNTETIFYEKQKQKTKGKINKKTSAKGEKGKKPVRKSPPTRNIVRKLTTVKKKDKKEKQPKDKIETKYAKTTEAEGGDLSSPGVSEDKSSEQKATENKTPDNLGTDFSLNDVDTISSIQNFLDIEEANVSELIEDIIGGGDCLPDTSLILGDDCLKDLEYIPPPDNIPAEEKEIRPVEAKIDPPKDEAMLATTCHQCKRKSRALKCLCKNESCSPAKSFCEKCLKRYDEDFSVVIADINWICPFCRNICTCSSCKKRSLDQNREFSSDSYQDYVNSANQSLKDFSWSKRNYYLKIENIGRDKEYRKLVDIARKQYFTPKKQTFPIGASSEEDAGRRISNPEEEKQDEKSVDVFVRSKLSRRGRGGKPKEGEALQHLLTFLLGLLMERDTNKWFSVPIDDKMAPGYSQVVSQPMDFTRMENKLDSRAYGTLPEFREDFRLICQNCIKFNKPDSPYHKAAKKLELYGLDLLSKKRIRNEVMGRPVYSSLAPFELGFDVHDLTDDQEDTNYLFNNDSCSSSTSEKENQCQHSKELQTLISDNSVKDIFISAAELVKKRGRSLSVKDSPSKTKKRKKSEGVDSQKDGTKDYDAEAERQEAASPSTVQHDYFGQTQEEDAPSKQSTVEKMRSLHLEKCEGTYVQCCREECKKWRFLTEFEDPAQVPEYWDCSMNKAPTASHCQVGGEEEDDVDFVNVKFTCGSVVWAKVKGYPWWPAIIDYCPDSEEYYWIEEAESRTDPAWYHVVFLEKSVQRSWVRAELVEKMTSPTKPPKKLGVKKNSTSMKSRLKKALEMASDCKNLPLKERLQKYSFASLFKGKWGEYSDISEDEEESGNKKKTKTSRSKSRSSSLDKRDPTAAKQNNLSFLETFQCEKCTEEVIYTKYPVVKHLKKHKMDMRNYCEKFDPDESNDKLALLREWIDREDFRKAIAEDPWKPNNKKKDKSSSEKKTIEEVVNDPSPKLRAPVYLTQRESEEFHLNSAPAKKGVDYQKPELSSEALIPGLEVNTGGAKDTEATSPIKLILPPDVMVLFVFNFTKKKRGVERLSREEIQQELCNLFLINQSDLAFVASSLKTDLFCESDHKYSVEKHLESFCVSALQKFIIDNLKAVIKNMRDIDDLKLILPRVNEGAEGLKTSFLAKTIQFCKVSCADWKPPINETEILRFAILSTVDINDSSTLSSVTDFIMEHFVWYRLTKQPFGLTSHASPDKVYSLSSEDAAIVRRQLQTAVTANMDQLRAMMPQVEVFNSVSQERLAADVSVYKRPPVPESVIVIIALLHVADQHGWASALKIQKFVEVNFPFYRLDMAISFLSKISSWITNKSTDGHFFRVEKESLGMMPQFQIAPDKFLAAYAWVGRFIKFTNGCLPLEYKQFMRFPKLIRDIIKLPPSSWKNYFGPEEEKLSTPGKFVTVNRNIFSVATSASPQSIPARQDSEWRKPSMETHMKIALAMIISKCRSLHEESPSRDEPLSMFSFQQKHSLNNIVNIIRETFPYYEPKEQTKEFVVEDIQQNKKQLGEYFNLLKNEDDKLEYELKSSVLSRVFEEILNLSDWRSVCPNMKTLLRRPDLARKMFGVRPLLSEDTMLSLILFMYGDPQDNFALPINSIIKVMMSQFSFGHPGFFGSKWTGDKIDISLRHVILSLVDLDLDFSMRETEELLDICLRTEEGRVDEIFANLQESVCSVSSKSHVRGKVEELMTRFMEMATPPTASSNQATLNLSSLPLEPPLPRNYLIALAMKNLSSRSVRMSQVWSFLSNTFPYFQDQQTWSLEELQCGLAFEGEDQFEYQVTGGLGDFSIALPQSQSDSLQRHLAEFSKLHIVEIQKSMRP